MHKFLIRYSKVDRKVTCMLFSLKVSNDSASSICFDAVANRAYKTESLVPLITVKHEEQHQTLKLFRYLIILTFFVFCKSYSMDFIRLNDSRSMSSFS